MQQTDTPLSNGHDHSSPTSPQSVDSMDSLSGKSGFFESKAGANLMSGYNPLGFNPLTPPGYSGLLVPPTQQQQQPGQNTQTRLSTPNRSFGKVDSVYTTNATLTPTHTPPMDVTPPKSPKEANETPVKEGEEHHGASDCEDASYDGSEDEDGIRKPKVNSHGQVKKFKCKQCDFVAVTKLNFWEHTRNHIKPEKMLTCPKCPFVTEYKHHLEYHLRNHQRSKPFQCPKCSYSCVNKSMLNSHMKSHSNVFQYRCADCNYATKYCHSLKLHLRKYAHKPDVVLNLDGTPNPLPIIDTPLTPQNHQGGVQPPFTPPGGQPSNGLMRNLFPHQLFPNPLAHMFKNAAANGNLPLFPYLNLNFQMFADQQANMIGQLSPTHFQQSLMGQLAGGDKLNNNNNHSSSSEDNDLSVKTNSSNGSSSLGEELLKQITAAAADSSASVMANGTSSFDQTGPDSEPDASSNGECPTLFDESYSQTTPVANPQTPSTGGVVGAKSERSRRKGRAFKLAQLSALTSNDMDTQYEDEDVPAKEEPSPAPSSVTCSQGAKEDSTRQQATTAKPTGTSAVVQQQRSLECKYCDIAFRDDVLYTIHMGYHGYDDVFKCNMCGEKSEDRIGFFLHIARKAH
ncbi:hypothetical protein ZHAS_00022318 [Anopheles sinensis]|uniref:Protein hunchback n=1 Tax=Anopheles sinensis TaxID=74873 RepID=A0A084WUI0_ANOSI|nr:hypothetical protein ZHAS_00022318 [Anopheles sinensis]